jgi:TRAP-type mannitol/chloroaromatic compound transport system substrate-binding protein
MTMNRRDLLRTSLATGVGLTLGACASAATPQPNTEENTPEAVASATTGSTEEGPAPAAPEAQELPAISWDMATSWPVALDTIFGGAQTVADRVSSLTGGRFTITPRAAGELAGGTEVLDVVQQGAVPIGHTAAYYYIGKSPVLGFGTSVPFGLTAQQQNAWLYEGGGLEWLQEFYAERFNVIQFPAGNTGTQMGGWFRREINTVADLQGLKMRIPGLGGQVMAKLGVTVQNLPGGEIFQALQTGAVDAAEWVGPYDDLKLGFPDVADFYYYPAWWEPGSTLEVQINLDEWNALPDFYKECIRTACYEANIQMLARYDARNLAALQEIIAGGTELRPYSEEIMEAAREATNELFDEFAAADADFAEIYEQWRQFRDNVHAWHQINEFSFESFVYGQQNGSS